MYEGGVRGVGRRAVVAEAEQAPRCPGITVVVGVFFCWWCKSSCTRFAVGRCSIGWSVCLSRGQVVVCCVSTENLLVLPVSSSLRVPIFLFLPETNEASGWMGVRPSVPGITCEIINRPWWWIAGRGRGCSRTSCQHYGPRGVLPRSVLAHPPQTLALCTFWWR